MTAYYNEFDQKAAAWLRELIADGLIAHGEVDERSIVDVAASDLKGFTQHHFFAGIGGWSYALRLAGWPDDLPVWTASLPCQPFSAAGKGLGKQDERHLLPHFISLVAQCRPTVLFGEQVSAAIKHGWLDDLYTEMEANNYAVGSIVIGAHSVGAAHIRQRLYWVADSTQQRALRESNKQRETVGGPKRYDLHQSISGSEVSNRMADNGSARRKEQSSQRGISRKTNGNESRENIAGGGLVVYSNESGSQQRIEATETARYRDTFESASSFDRLHDPKSKRRSVHHTEDVNWIYCRDNKYRPIESGFIEMVDGISCTMVHSGHKIKEEINDKAMSTMRQDVGTKENAIKIGRFNSIQEKEILRPSMHGESLRRGHEGTEFSKRSSAIEETSKGCMRSVCSNDIVTRTSCRRESDEQQSFKFEDVVRQMSPGSTLSQFFCPSGASYMQALRKTSDEKCVMLDAQQPVSEIWRSFTDEEKDRVELHFSKRCWIMRNSIKPLVIGISCDPFNTQEARTVRLKGYGNAIQVQTARSFIRAFMESEL